MVSFVTRKHTHRLRVGYSDTDRAAVVHHAAYLRFLEAGRVESWRAFGLDYRRFEEETGMGLPVVEAKLRYRNAARFDDLLEIETWVERASRASLWFEGTIRRVEGRGPALIVESSVRLACVSFAHEELRKIPDAVVDACLEPGWQI